MASSGAEKWFKYFSNGCSTIIKNDTQLLDLDGKTSGIVLKRGDAVEVFGGDYSSKPRVLFNGLEGRIKLSDLDKPIHAIKTVKFDLKPDKIGLVGRVEMKRYHDHLQTLIHDHDEIPSAAKNYLSALTRYAHEHNETSLFLLEKSFLEIKDDRPLINTINRDFLESLGPLISLTHDHQFIDLDAFFPEAGNEPLYDFKLISNDREELFSSKKSSGSTNTLKAALLYDRCQGVKGFERELELFKIIKESKVKDAPNAINEWLDKTFTSYIPFKPAAGCEEIVRLEANVVKYINESDLSFTPLIKMAIPEIWYVKAEINNQGILRSKPLQKAKEISKVLLRSKSSPNHICDKLGFQV